ncbi:MAG: hypothetical protein ACKO0Z_08165 [Betaproteobacteria bacterium]
MKKQVTSWTPANFANPAKSRMATGRFPSQRLANLCESQSTTVSNAKPPSVPSIQEEAPAQLDSTQLNPERTHMQLNPFKKSGAYYNGIKSKYDALTRQLESTTAELTTAKANYLQRNAAYQEMLAASKLSRSSPADRQLLAQLNNAESQVKALELRLRSLNSDVTELRHTVEAPESLKKVKTEIAALARQEAELSAKSEKTQTQIEKFDERITVLEERIVQETQIAAQSMLESDAEFVTPDALSKLDTELRIAQITQKELKAKLELLRSELASIPATQRDLRRSYISNRATVAEIDSREALLPILKLLARTSIAKREAGHARDSRIYEISIPTDLLDEAEAELASESSTS